MLEEMREIAELGCVEGLECAFGVAYEIDLAGVGFGVDVVDEGGDLGGGSGDGEEATDRGGGGFGAVGEGVDAVVVDDEVGGEGGEGGGVGGHAVEEDDGVVGGGAG